MGLDDLIAALASPPGPSATGIIRLSGPPLRSLVESAFEPDDRSTGTRPASPRRLAGRWRLGNLVPPVPCSLMYWPTARSFTGQPTAELHLPGSPPLLERVLEELFCRGARPARPGEFTLRAFLAGKIDLVQAEAVLGVIEAHDDAELRTALEQLAGGISTRLNDLRTDLIDLLADLEAGMDFVDEDIEFVSRHELQRRIVFARQFVEELLQQAARRMTSRTLPKVVLAGLPNAGKSTLFNWLAGESLALVSSEHGTTRDYLRANVDLSGCTFELIDTAGWENVSEGIPAAAQSLRVDQLDRAALVLWCSAGDQTDEQQQRDEAAFVECVQASVPVLRLQTKCELCGPSEGRRIRTSSSPVLNSIRSANSFQSEAIAVSVTANLGLDELRSRMAEMLANATSPGSTWLGMTAARCRDSLEQARDALNHAESIVHQPSIGDELLAVDLRSALDRLGAVIGAVYTDDLLDRIFSKFCIGK